jgi:hypothetical protein
MGIQASEKRVRRSAEEWRGLVERFGGSGLSQAEFCRQEGISAVSLSSWRRKLGFQPVTGGKRRREEPSAKDEPGEWVELPVGALGGTGRGWEIELDLGEGVCLRLRRP